MWIVPVSIAILILIILFMPKYITKREIYITWGVVGFVAWIVDMISGAILDLYDFGPTKDITWIDVLAVSIIPAGFAIIFLNFLPKSKRVFIYGIGWTLITLLFVWLTTYTGYLQYKGWKTWYSIPAWLFIYLLFLRWHLHFIRGKKN